MTESSSSEPRLIVSYAHAEAYVSMARVILSRMGYVILSEEEWRESPPFAVRQPELRLVDEHRLEGVPDDPEGQRIPMILLTGRRGAEADDPRIVGAIRKPAGLHEIYRLAQQTLEAVPRSSLRVPTHISARCRDGDQEWQGALLSLSENGCLLRCAEPVSLGAQLEVTFELPRTGVVETRAESAYQLLPDTGLVFQETPPEAREAILAFVEENLAA